MFCVCLQRHLLTIKLNYHFTKSQVLAVISIGFVIVSTAALILSTIPAFQVRVFGFEVEKS